MEVEWTECNFRLSRVHRGHQPPPLAQFFSLDLKKACDDFTNDDNGKSQFAYPRLQFKIVDRMASFIGINEGSEWLQGHWDMMVESEPGFDQLEVLDENIETRTEEIGSTEDAVEYRFLTPWLALNEKNYRDYIDTRRRNTRRTDLSRILVSNCLGMFQCLDVQRDHFVEAKTSALKSVKSSIGRKPTIGFLGTFTINVHLPDYIGIGRAASSGFGTLRLS